MQNNGLQGVSCTYGRLTQIGWTNNSRLLAVDVSQKQRACKHQKCPPFFNPVHLFKLGDQGGWTATAYDTYGLDPSVHVVHVFHPPTEYRHYIQCVTTTQNIKLFLSVLGIKKVDNMDKVDRRLISKLCNYSSSVIWGSGGLVSTYLQAPKSVHIFFARWTV